MLFVLSFFDSSSWEQASPAKSKWYGLLILNIIMPITVLSQIKHLTFSYLNKSGREGELNFDFETYIGVSGGASVCTNIIRQFICFVIIFRCRTDMHTYMYIISYFGCPYSLSWLSLAKMMLAELSGKTPSKRIRIRQCHLRRKANQICFPEQPSQLERERDARGDDCLL